MATTQRAERSEPGTEIQLAGSAAVGKLPPEYQQALEMRKMRNQVAAQIAGTNWGKGLDIATARGIADWGQQFRVDVTTEIHVLGGNIYLAAAFWMRQLAEMIAAGLVEYAYADHVEADARLATIGEDGEGESSRRLRERIKHGIPDKAASAVVFRVKLRSMDKEVVGVKYCGNGTRTNDPVGEKFPVETAESRAARRAMRLLASHVPPAKAVELDAIEQSADILSERVGHARKEIRAGEARIAQLPPGRSGMPATQAPLVDPTDPYSPVDESKVPLRNADEPREDVASRVAPPVTDAQRAAAASAAGGSDPYDDEGATRSEAGEATPLAGPHLFPMPFTWEGVDIKTPLGLVASAPLGRAVAWAKGSKASGRYMDFIAAAEMVLDDRKTGAAKEPAAQGGEGA